MHLVGRLAGWLVLDQPTQTQPLLRFSQNIPAVAQLTQGEVINFAAAATAKMSADGFNVLMEGRAQTLDYVRSPHRFELTLKVWQHRPQHHPPNLVILYAHSAQHTMNLAVGPTIALCAGDRLYLSEKLPAFWGGCGLARTDRNGTGKTLKKWLEPQHMA